MTKEQIYDTQIYPLMEQIIRICKEHKIAHVCTFSLDKESELFCTTNDISDECEPPDVLVDITALLFPPEPKLFAFAISCRSQKESSNEPCEATND
jgi:hypothetical protein